METTTQDINLGDNRVITVTHPVVNKLTDFARMDNSGVDLYKLERSGLRNVPTVEAQQNMYVDRTKNNPRGTWQIAIRAEREALMGDIMKMRDQINSQFKGTADALYSAIRYLPNSRFAYLNKLIRTVLATGRSKRGDYDYMDTIWMAPETMKAMKEFLASVMTNEDGFSIEPTQSRSGIALQDSQGVGRMQLKLANPGLVTISERQYDTTTTDAIIEQLSKRIQELYDEITMTEDMRDLFDSEVTANNNSLTKSLLHLRAKLLSQTVNYKDLMSINESLNNFLGLQKSKYLLSLSNPWKYKGARIPTMITPPSATFTLRTAIPLTTNALGNVAFIFNPFALFYTTGATVSTFGIGNAATLDGVTASVMNAVDCGQSMPSPFYARHRLVSAGIKIYCYPSSNNDNGLLTTSVTFETHIGYAVGTAMGTAAQFTDFKLIDNGYFKETTTIASRQVQEHVYIPIDESKFDYAPVSSSGTNAVHGFTWVGYITGAAPSQSIARIETCCNYEALVENEFIDYLPSESPTDQVDPKQIHYIINKVKQSESSITPKTINDALHETGTGITDNTSISLPPLKQITDIKKDEANTLTKVLTDIVRDTVKKTPIEKKQSWLTTIMEKLNPIAASIVETAANNAFGSMFGKFGLTTPKHMIKDYF